MGQCVYCYDGGPSLMRISCRHFHDSPLHYNWDITAMLCHSQVYHEGAITPRRIMTGRRGPSPRNCTKEKHNQGEGPPGYLDHKEDGAWNREITRSALARNSCIPGRLSGSESCCTALSICGPVWPSRNRSKSDKSSSVIYDG